MTTHLANLVDKYHNLILLDTESLSPEGKEKYVENMHKLEIMIPNLEAKQLHSVNQQVLSETANLNEAIDKLSNTALSDDIYLALCNAVSNSIDIIGSLLGTAL